MCIFIFYINEPWKSIWMAFYCRHLGIIIIIFPINLSDILFYSIDLSTLVFDTILNKAAKRNTRKYFKFIREKYNPNWKMEKRNKLFLALWSRALTSSYQGSFGYYTYVRTAPASCDSGWKDSPDIDHPL